MGPPNPAAGIMLVNGAPSPCDADCVGCAEFCFTFFVAASFFFILLLCFFVLGVVLLRVPIFVADALGSLDPLGAVCDTDDSCVMVTIGCSPVTDGVCDDEGPVSIIDLSPAAVPSLIALAPASSGGSFDVWLPSGAPPWFGDGTFWITLP